MLFCPPQPPVPVREDATISIGRHSSCDLTILRHAVSRRHAEIVYDGDGYLLRDLGSRNGTYLNGERVEGTARLRSGDKIEIGPSAVTFCQLDSVDGPALDASAAHDAPTIYFERPNGGDAFQGNLAEIPAFAVFQVLEMGSKTGTLEITAAGEVSRIWFASGAPIHAETEKHVGADAALSLMNASQGEFRFESQPVTVTTTIQASITELLLEACRLADEAAVVE